MEELSTGDWSLIARYLTKEASQKDLALLNDLADRTRNLREEIEVLRQRMNTPATPGPDIFNSDQAFEKLHQRICAEGLV